MKKTALLLCLILGFSLGLFAEDHEQVWKKYHYFELGAGPLPIAIPQIGWGYRSQKGHHGFDVETRAFTMIFSTPISLGLHYLVYPKPSMEKEFYFGGGPIFMGIIADTGGMFSRCKMRFFPSIAPEFLFGKEFRTKSGKLRHLQFQCLWPLYSPNNLLYEDLLLVPMCSLNYSWGF